MRKSIGFAAAICGVMIALSPALADVDYFYLTVSDSLASPLAKQKLDGSVKFFFGDAPHPAVVQSFGEVAFKEKAGFLKSNATACNEAFVSALADFQVRAKASGGNAVINLRSFYKKNDLAIDKTAPCILGGLRVGVTLKGEVVKLAE